MVQTPFPCGSILHSPSCISQDIPAIEGEDAGTGSQWGPAAHEKGFPVIEEHFILVGRVGKWRRRGFSPACTPEHSKSSKPQQPLGRECFS